MQCISHDKPSACTTETQIYLHISNRAGSRHGVPESTCMCCRVILSWFPAFDWERTIWRELRQVTDPYLNIFTGIVPPLLGAIDLTPLLGFFVLQALKGYLTVYTDDDIEAWW
jgi:uncharacterized protein YggT (Ycf19 family)